MAIDGIVQDVNKIQERKRTSRKKEKMAPFIIFKLSKEMTDKAKMEEYLKDNIKDVTFEDYKLTAYGNLFIYIPRAMTIKKKIKQR
jgi:hypothetical protein